MICWHLHIDKIHKNYIYFIQFQLDPIYDKIEV